MKAAFKRRLVTLEGRMKTECDLRQAIEAWGMAKVLTLAELNALIEEFEVGRKGCIHLPPDMAARVADALEVISLELTGGQLADLSAVPRRIREQAIYSLTKQMDRDQELRVMKQLEARGLARG